MSGSARRTAWWVLLASVAGLGAWALAGGDPAKPVDVRPAARRAPPSLVGTLALSDALGTVASGFGSAWIDDRAARRLLRVDPERGRVEARIPIGGAVSVGIGGGAVWALERGRGWGNALTGPLLRVDPATNRVTGRVRVRTADGRPVPAYGVLAHRRGVWIWGPRDLLRVDARTPRVDRSLAIPAERGDVTGAAVLRGELVLATADGRLLRRDLRSGAPRGSARVPLALTAVRTDGRRTVLVSGRGVIAEADPLTGRVLWRRRLGYRIGGAVGIGGVVWVQASPSGRPRDILVGLEPGTGRELTRTDVAELGTVAMAGVAGRLWLTSQAGRVVVVDP